MKQGSMTKGLPVLLLLLSTYHHAAAQSNRGSISGTIADRSGAVIAGAHVSAKEDSTGSEYHAVSSSSGGFTLPELQVGNYDVRAEAPGFKTAQRVGVVVQINSTSSLDFALDPGSVTETVSVNANAVSLQSETSDVGTVVTTKQVIDLPLALGGVGALRSPEAFVFLTPGTAGPGSGSSDNGSSNAGSNNNVFQSKISGGQNYATEILLDGASETQAVNGSAYDETAPSVEAIQEFKVTTSSIPAEFGRTTGGVESFTTKSGGNAYHGSVFEIFKNEDLDANTWFNNGYLSQTPHSPTFQRPSDKKNDYGVNLGGPVRIPRLSDGRNRSFFFFSWEQYKQNQGGTVTSTVPTIANRAGDFSANLNTAIVLGTNPCDGQPIYQGQIFNPTTTTSVDGVTCRSPFPGNVIPAPQFSAVAKNVLTYLASAIPISDAPQQNYAYSGVYGITNTTYTIRIDENLAANDKLFVSYSSRDNTRRNGSPTMPEPINNCCQVQNFTSHYARLGYDHTFSPNVLNHLTLGYNRPNSINYALAVTDNKDYPALLGIGNLSAKTFPSLSFGEGLNSIGFANNDDLIENGARLEDSVSWATGRNSFKFGFDYRFQQQSPLAYDNEGGTFSFGRDQTSATASTANLSGNGFASFLLGETASGSVTVPFHQSKWIYEYSALFAQDDLKVNRRLTVNLGLRWDVDMPRYESQQKSSNFDPLLPNTAAGNLPGALVFAGSGAGRSGRSSRWASVWYKDFGPRVGFAWTPPGFAEKTVLRGGYGVVYAPITYSDFGGSLNTGYTATPNFVSSDGFSPAFVIDSGFPAYPQGPNLDPTQANNQSVNYVARGYGRPGMVQGWSMELQQEVAPSLVASIGYIGQHSTHLRSNLRYVNQLNPEFYPLGTALLQPANGNTVGAALPFPDFTGTVGQALRPFPQYQSINTSCCIENLGQSTYSALISKIEGRFKSGGNLLASYTWSKAITDADSALPPLESDSGIQNPYYLRGEKSISIQDIPNTIVVSYIYPLPLGKGRQFLSSGGITDYLLGGWQIGAVQRYQSGQPISFGCATAPPATYSCFRFDRVPGQSLTSESAGSKFNPFHDLYFNPAAFQDPNGGSSVAANGYTFGNLPRVTSEVRMSWFNNEDFSIVKNTKISEGITVQFRGELLNAFNRHIFNHPATNPNQPNFGLVTSTLNAPRNVQFELRVNY